MQKSGQSGATIRPTKIATRPPAVYLALLIIGIHDVGPRRFFEPACGGTSIKTTEVLGELRI